VTRIPAFGPARAPAFAGTGRASRIRARAERFFWLAGLCCVGIAGAAIVQSYVYQKVESEAFDRALESRALESRALPRTVPASEEPLGFSPPRASVVPPVPIVIGRLEIPRLGIRAMVREGVDDETLKVAIGHIPGTARPGDYGNIGLAAHRDTFFRALRDVRKGDVMRLTTLDGSETYRVASATVVDPARVGVLAGTNETRSLTLVTCFPFDFIGAAPKRFVVAALAAGDARAKRATTPHTIIP
jgi:sortase A